MIIRDYKGLQKNSFVKTGGNGTTNKECLEERSIKNYYSQHSVARCSTTTKGKGVWNWHIWPNGDPFFMGLINWSPSHKHRSSLLLPWWERTASQKLRGLSPTDFHDHFLLKPLEGQVARPTAAASPFGHWKRTKKSRKKEKGESQDIRWHSQAP